MDLLNIENFTIETLQSLIENEVEENVHLDNKADIVTQKNNWSKNEITKDVSTFANEEDGIISYVLAERDHKLAEFTTQRRRRIPLFAGLSVADDSWLLAD